MDKHLRDKLRITAVVRQQLADLHRQRCADMQSQFSSLLGNCDRLRSQHASMLTACQRHWHDAARRLMTVQQNLVAELRSQLRALPDLRRIRDLSPPTQRQIVEELDQITDEFSHWEFNAQTCELRVRTDAIELEEIYLGSFEIQLRLRDLSSIGQSQPYRIDALDPHPASGNGFVTHPHVNDRQLCAGDAMTPIRAALKSGRLCDFFMLVHGVLTHYNPESPYVSLSDWEADPCSDCNVRVDNDDRRHCDHCDNILCSDCGYSCNACRDFHCPDCVDKCPSCCEFTCRNCMSPCDECDEPCCSLCLEESLCPTCYQEYETAHEKDQEENKQSERDEGDNTTKRVTGVEAIDQGWPSPSANVAATAP